ncbi:hypothetical protein [Peribacillus frigoritolerans]|uniref:hypothetical protein n=1 Tax=Peribacillus frigoritolerans TaxID=450367 RepID=UPI003F7E2649
MPHHLDRMAEDLVKAKLENYWPGFELVAYAIYDKGNAECTAYVKKHRTSHDRKSDAFSFTFQLQFSKMILR